MSFIDLGFTNSNHLQTDKQWCIRALILPDVLLTVNKHLCVDVFHKWLCDLMYKSHIWHSALSPRSDFTYRRDTQISVCLSLASIDSTMFSNKLWFVIDVMSWWESLDFDCDCADWINDWACIISLSLLRSPLTQTVNVDSDFRRTRNLADEARVCPPDNVWKPICSIRNNKCLWGLYSKELNWNPDSSLLSTLPSAHGNLPEVLKSVALQRCSTNIFYHSISVLLEIQMGSTKETLILQSVHVY